MGLALFPPSGPAGIRQAAAETILCDPWGGYWHGVYIDDHQAQNWVSTQRAQIAAGQVLLLTLVDHRGLPRYRAVWQ